MPIEVKNLSYTYGKKTPLEKQALNDVSFTVSDGECIGIVGSTGSGKSTLIQHLNGLIKLTSGSIKVDEIDLSAKKPDYRALRRKIGMLFQYPEYQLFAETVLDDVKFGPLNFGMTKEEADASSRKALELVGLDFEDIKDRSPIEISGGQKRRVAIAGVLSYNPHILILDEPTAGLDPIGKKEMLELISSLRKTGAVKTVIMVSHNMDEIAEYTDRVILLNGGKKICDLPTREFFYSKYAVQSGLSLPHAANITKMLEAKGFILPECPLTKTELVEALKKHCLKEGV